jgi:bifunctional DNA-binding transcriptional regulator/antitoxin component of YhaV-PrlF toxin-antitoxin module
MRSKGNLTLPVELRRKYKFNEGDIFTLIDLGDGVFMLTPQASTLERLGDRVSEILTEEEVTLDDVLTALDEERERYYKDRYVRD